MKAHSLFAALAAVLLLLAGVVVFAAPGAAAPALLNCGPANAAISSPAAGSSINGIVQIEGTASLGGDFQYYKLEVSPAGREAYNAIAGLVRQQVNGGQLGVWDSASVPDGVYTIRLRVVDPTGNYCEATVTGLQVNNSAAARATDTPAPTETEGPVPTSVVPTILPTINVPGSELASGEAQATAEATPEGTQTPGSGGTSLLPGGIDLGNIAGAIGQLVSGYIRAFLFGVIAMAGILVVVGVIFYVRRIL